MQRKDNRSSIRNFSIIAHIDHGKSTLADRLLEYAKVTNQRTKRDQILDSMDLERERGITIKLNSATFGYESEAGEQYIYNLIDTPGHVDFSYEVSRSLAACEGVLLIVDATQGVEAQTLANLYLAMEQDLTVIPVINKIDLPAADVPRMLKLIDQSLGLDPDLAIPVSAKTGENVRAVLEAIAKHIPAPGGSHEGPLRALIYDSVYDNYAGAIIKVRVRDGFVKKGERIRMFATPDKEFHVAELGITAITPHPRDLLDTGEVGYMIAGVKSVDDTRVGDTVTSAAKPADRPLPGYQEAKPMVFAGLFPINGEDYGNLKDAILKLKLNDASLVFEPENSPALGFGYRVGYLGLLHMEIVAERLSREFDLALISTAPTVKYQVHPLKGESYSIDNPSNWPDLTTVEYTEEPYVKASIMTPQEYLGNILSLLQEKRGEQENLVYLEDGKVQAIYAVPLAELIFEFYDRLKSVSRGYASLDYDITGYRESKLVKVDILVNAEPVDALAMICHRSNAEYRGRQLIEKLKELIPRHQFQIPLQAAIGAKVIARENISALRKNVTAKCYGGDISRKRKLIEKQKEGKKRMKSIGNVDIPQEAFLAVLKSDGA